MDKKIKILIVSVLAGSGHNSAADLMEQLLAKDPRFKVVRYTNPTKRLDTSYNLVTKYTPVVFNMLAKYAPKLSCDLLTLYQIDFVDDAVKVIQKEKPDVILSTHFSMAYSFKIAQWVLNRPLLNITGFLDYGRQPSGYFPYNIYLRSEYSLVFDDVAYASLKKKTGQKDDHIIISGHHSRNEFVQAAHDYSEKKLARVKLASVYPGAPYQQLGTDKTTILIAGGGGGLIHHTFGLLRQISAKQKEDISLLDKYQFFVICGQNEKYYQKILKVRAKKLSWQNIFPFAWLDAKKYALIQRASDFPVLFGCAPATMHELLETGCMPLLVHKLRAVHELENVKFFEKRGLAIYQPDADQVLDYIFSEAPLSGKEVYLKKAREVLDLEAGHIAALPDKIASFFDPRVYQRAREIYKVRWYQVLVSWLLMFFTLFVYYLTKFVLRARLGWRKFKVLLKFLKVKISLIFRKM
jgi:UDP-N-acetylglucosamine:LPS N-acetylglucosamine transferase